MRGIAGSAAGGGDRCQVERPAAASTAPALEPEGPVPPAVAQPPSPANRSAKERAFIANLIDQGLARAEIVKAFISRYPGESALVVPVDTGFNRLAWLIPILAIVGAAGGLSLVARRWSQNGRQADAAEKKAMAATSTPDPKADQKYIDRLDDDLDDLD